MKLYIIRHGETPWNKVRKLQGRTDIPLADTGIVLAKETGKNLQKVPFDLVFTSPLTRARQTAECVLGEREIPIITDERIQEISFGDWEGECILNSTVLPTDFMEQFVENPRTFKRPPHGENLIDVSERTHDFYEFLIHTPEYQDKTILISTHGAAGRCLLNHFYEDDDIWRGGVPKNCAVSIIEVQDGKSAVLEKDKIFYEE
ncbi:MAG: histidine phosphatase family protein [Lachnospiraceae bacterium]|nr:histidine phosphatase family protein [Lachnospiraceae bacterium]